MQFKLLILYDGKIIYGHEVLNYPSVGQRSTYNLLVPLFKACHLATYDGQLTRKV